MNGMEEDGEEISVSTPLDKVTIRLNERVVLVDVYMPSIRQAHDNLIVVVSGLDYPSNEIFV